MIPRDQCVHRGLYRIHSRTLTLGVYDAEDGSFIGIRTKLGSRFLFAEFHRDNGAPFGTVTPTAFLEMLPEGLELKEHEPTRDATTGRLVAFDRPVSDGGRGWYFVETGHTGDIRPQVSPYQPLFDYLDHKERETP